MFSRILTAIDGFLRFKYKESSSKLESIGDFFLKPIRVVFDGMDYQIIANQRNVHCYSLSDNIMDFHPDRTPRRKRILYGLLLPFAAIGIPFNLKNANLRQVLYATPFCRKRTVNHQIGLACYS